MKSIFILSISLLTFNGIFASDFEKEVDVFGCTDPLACNYNASANISDGSCYYASTNDACSGAISLSIGSNATVDNTCSTSNGSTPINWSDGVQNDVWFSFVAPLSGGVTISTSGISGGTLNDSQIAVWSACGSGFIAGDDDSGVGEHASLTLNCSQLIAGNTYYIQVDGFAGAQGTCQISLAAASVLGCTNSSAANYSACATTDDGSCTNQGCTNPSACNYNANATVDNGTCCFSTCGEIEITSGLYPSEISYQLVNGVNTVLFTGTGASSGSVCLSAGCYQFRMSDSFGDGWNTAVYSLTDQSSNVIIQGTFLNNPVYNAFNDTVGFSIGGGILGCTDNTACNYNASATCDDASCEYESCRGCTNSAACNFDPSATINDGSCCLSNCLTFTMYDSMGDTWNGGTYTLVDLASTVLYSGTMDATASSQTTNFCVADGCYYLQINGGDFPSEISWSLAGTNTGTLTGTGSTTSTGASVGTNNDCFGCTIPTACNYNPLATFANNSTCILGPCVAGDNPWTAINTSPSITSTCTNYNGTFTGATVTSVANSAVITGEDIWYKFTAAHSAISIQVTALSTNGVIELLDNTYQTIDTENLTGNGLLERMNIGGLTIGQTYYVGVRNYNSSVGAGNFSICLQYLRYTTPISGAGPFSLCNQYKAAYRGAGVSYRFEFTQTTSPNLTFTRTQASDVLILGNCQGLAFSRNYNAKIFAIYTVQDGLGNNEVVESAPPAFTAMSTATQPSSELKSTDRCSSGARLRNANVSTLPWICGSTAWQWEFTKINPSTGLPIASPITYMVNTNSNILGLGFVSALEYGATYSVRTRPYFLTEAGVYGNPQTMCIVSSAMILNDENKEQQLVQRNEVLEDDLQNLTAFPNPSTGIFILQMPETQSKVFYQITDMTGKIVETGLIPVGTTRMDLNLSHLGTGIYQLHTRDPKDNQERLKLVISN
ncbi:MAG: T9SS type A sorting domain-containing protein [Bacteroidota bacterium]